MNWRMVLFAAATMHAGMAACLMSGKVGDAETGKPVVGARVSADPLGSPFKPAIVRLAGLQGVFCFERLETGVYKLISQRAGYMPLVYGGRLGSTEGMELNVDGVTEAPAMTLKMTQIGRGHV